MTDRRLTVKRPTWATVARQDLSNQLKAESLAMLDEAKLWHEDKGHEVVARAACQLAFMAQLVDGDCSDATAKEGESWLDAARTMLPRIQLTRERRALGLVGPVMIEADA